jgi:L-2-hydroxyglutarate oxidase LhgO
LIVEVDAAIIGGGVVGLACAAAIARGGKSTVVLEQHRALGTETTSRNSEVIHAGLYYVPGSLKATLCVRGAELLYEWCAAKAVPHARCGKLVVAVSDAEASALDALRARATTNGARVEMITGERARALEPNVEATCALVSPNTGIVDSHAFVATLAADIAAHDGIVAIGRRLVAAERSRDRWLLDCDGVVGRERIEASWVINAAGLYADDVAMKFGLDVVASGVRQQFVKGSYFRSRRALVKHLVYPVPPSHGHGLGVHATIDLAGHVRFGPDTEPAKSRDDYAVDELRAHSFGEAIRTYLPALRDEDLVPDTSGIRPKVASGDFMFVSQGTVLHLAGIESPGLTAALAIAEHAVMIMS